jgi:hypothetical protein
MRDGRVCDLEICLFVWSLRMINSNSLRLTVGDGEPASETANAFELHKRDV